MNNRTFFLNYRINTEYGMISHLIHGKLMNPDEMTELYQLLRNDIVATQLQQNAYDDIDSKPNPNLECGDIVAFFSQNIKTTIPSKKLHYKKIGPVKILAKIRTRAYKLDLPRSMAIDISSISPSTNLT